MITIDELYHKARQIQTQLASSRREHVNICVLVSSEVMYALQAEAHKARGRVSFAVHALTDTNYTPEGLRIGELPLYNIGLSIDEYIICEVLENKEIS